MKIENDTLAFNIESPVDLCSSISIWPNDRRLSFRHNSNIKAKLIIPLVPLYVDLSQKRWSYCAAPTFSSTAHWILQLLPLSREATLGGCSWMQRQKLPLVQFPQKLCTSLSCQRRKSEKMRPTVNTFTKCGDGGHWHVCKGYPCAIKGNSAAKPNVRIISLDYSFNYFTTIDGGQHLNHSAAER